MTASGTRPPVARLGCTLPQLVFEARSRYGRYPALHRHTGSGWETTTSEELCARAGHIALGLLSFGLRPGDRVSFYLHSDSGFVLADLGCLIAGIVDVPIYISQATEAVHYVLEHSGSRAVFFSDPTLLADLRPSLSDLPGLETVILLEGSPPSEGTLPVVSLAQLEEDGARQAGTNPQAVRTLADQRYPDDLATIIYTSGTTGTPKGVMLSHENLSSNALYTYQETGLYDHGPDGETVLSFLPMSHVFARMMCYASLAFGSPIWFSTPERLVDDFQEVRPTVFATVPRVLEKMYGKIIEKSNAAGGVRGTLARWALRKAQQWELGQDRAGLSAVSHRTADRLVYAKWRAVMGGRVKMISCGGAALNAEIVRVFGAAGIHLLQGYGLSETSPVITFNRPESNRPGWVGKALPHIEVKVAEDGEICTRGPHIMLGYYKAPDLTSEVIDEDGWLHTGDIGVLEDGFLKITDRKKDLFKLSTGKYVMPQPLENKLTTQPLVEQAVVVGAGHKFTTALLFPNEDSVRRLAGGTGRLEELVQQEPVVAAFTELVRQANQGMDHWATIKRFRLVPDHVSVDNGLLTPTLKIRRPQVRERFSAEIDSLYTEAPCEPPVIAVESLHEPA